MNLFEIKIEKVTIFKKLKMGDTFAIIKGMLLKLMTVQDMLVFKILVSAKIEVKFRKSL